MITDYLKFEKNEFVDLTFITSVLALLFSLTYLRFSNVTEYFFVVFISFFIFLFTLLGGKLLFMKFFAYRNEFEINMKMTYFDRYWFRDYDRLSYTTNKAQQTAGIKVPKHIKGLPMPIVSLFLYILTLGLLIIPNVWRYSLEKIPHLFLGSKKKYEKKVFFEVSNYRYGKVLFAGFIYYFLFGLMLKIIFGIFENSFFNWFSFALYWIAFMTLIPLLGTEGYELFYKARLGWFSALTIMVLGMLALLVFQSLTYVIGVTIIGFVIIFIFMLWEEII